MHRRILIAAVLACAAAAAATATAQTQQISIDAPWARASVGNSRIAVAYMTVRNDGAASDRLLSVSSPVGRAELHTMTMDNNVMRMRPVEAVDIPPRGIATLQPSGLHIMLLDLREPLRAGASVSLTLRFERAGTVELSVPVQPANATRPPAAAVAPAAPVPHSH